jgi:diguanylate cyclase (GGDEF)-like protein
VAQRIERIVPAASAWVIELDRSPRALARAHRAQGPLAVVGLPHTVWEDAQTVDGIVPCEQAPAWLASLAPTTPHRTWVCHAMAGGERLAMLVLFTPQDAVLDSEALREIIELRNRVSVALSSADRERRLVERATRDSLTGLVNRSGLYEAIDAMLADAAAMPFSVLFVDLDRFKEVNDSLGHQVGDDLLRAVAGRLLQCAPPGALVARPGGDEFVLVVRGARQAADALASLLSRELPRPIELQGRSVVVGTSIGIARHPEHGGSAMDLIRRADLAMFSAKLRGGGAIAWFEPSMDARVAERAGLLADLRLACVRHELEVHYQPRVHLRSRSVKCAEALLRWRSPTRGLVAPDTFIPLLEETGLIEEVGLWVIEQAAAQLAQCRAQGATLESVAVNLSTRQLEADGFPAQVVATLARHGLQPADLELEVTESIFMGDRHAATRALHRLHESGVRIALDDFGTGYSSLSYLHKLPIGVLKVDRSFVADLGRRDSALALTRSIIALGRALNLHVVAEGVETESQVEILTGLGCDELQGWLYAPALDRAAFADFLKRPLTPPVAA